LEKIIHYKLGLNDKIENIKTFTKRSWKKIGNQNKKDQIEKTYT
jgi:hypothetical protein